jgi:hypothetical protein
MMIKTAILAALLALPLCSEAKTDSVRVELPTSTLLFSKCDVTEVDTGPYLFASCGRTDYSTIPLVNRRGAALVVPTTYNIVDITSEGLEYTFLAGRCTKVAVARGGQEYVLQCSDVLLNETH